mgnify:CR=1 FL=1
MEFSTDFSPFDIETSIIELASNSENRVNTGTDFYHYGLGVNFGYKRVNFILGTVYTHGKSDFLNSNDENIFPELLIDQIATIKQSRWRFLIGFEILFLIFSNSMSISLEINPFSSNSILYKYFTK